METMLWTLAGAFIIAMTTLAYRKPYEYQRLVGYILILIGTVAIISMAYAMGYLSGSSDASRYFSANENASWYNESPFPFDPIIGFFSVMGACIYLVVLTALPQILGWSGDQPNPPEAVDNDKTE